MMLRAAKAACPVARVSSNYKGFPTFVKQNSLVVNRAAIDHET
jgi:hypothetical protein